MKKGKIIILSGPSGSGKTTLYKKILANTRDLVKTVSVTTRPKRPGEKHGHDYFFVSHKQFLYKKRAGHFLESQKVFENYYGTPKKGVRDLLASGQNVFMCIDVKGARVVCKKFPKAVRIFIKTPSVAVLKKRLLGRGSEDKKELKLRLRTALKELKEAKKYDYVISNDDFSHAYQKLFKIITAILSSS